MSYLHLPTAELVALLRTAATWLRPGGRLLYVGHSRTTRALGVGGPSDPEVLPEIEDLARAAKRLRTGALEHLVLPTGEIIVLLQVRPRPMPAPRSPPR